ncbi:MAG: glycine--tRNA ligase [Candidatus Paceibacterota bacterium]
MTDKENNLEEIVSLAKQRGFIYQGSEIYGGLAGTWDYGPLGVELVRNIKNIWWKQFVQARPDIYGVDADILMSAKVWQASGHVDGFSDPLVEDVKTKKRYRADHLLEEAGVAGAEGMTIEEMDAAIKEKGVKSPDGNELGQVQEFNMMFATEIGASGESAETTYLRPETAQGMFVNFKNIIDSFHPDIPFGMAQIGKAFRNEITPRNFLFRTREFEQMEVEYFVRPDEWEDSFEMWRKEIWTFMESIGLDTDKVSEYDVPDGEGAHYAKRTIDFEFSYPFGTKELYGLAYRTDYDLTNHIDGSGEKLEYFDQAAGERFVPHVIEPSLGIDRTVLALLCSALETEEVDGDERTVLRLAKKIAPIKVAVLPLQRKDGLPEKAQEVFATLQQDFVCQYDKTASIGKRYRRQDEVGTPYCVTIDYDTLEDDTVTIRDRDTMEQERVAIGDLVEVINTKLSA